MTGHDRFVVVPAAYVFLLRGAGEATEVLLQLRRGTGFMDGHWAAAAAGHVERGETAVQAACREAYEEVGLDLDADDLMHLTTMQRTRDGDPIDERVDFFFTARSWRGEPTCREPERSAGIRWCGLRDLDQLPDPVVPHERAVLVSLLQGSTPAYTTFGFTPVATAPGGPR